MKLYKLFSLIVSLVVFAGLAGTVGAQSPPVSPPTGAVTLAPSGELKLVTGVVEFDCDSPGVFIGADAPLSLNWPNVCRQCLATYQATTAETSLYLSQPLQMTWALTDSTGLLSSNAVYTYRKPPENLALVDSTKFDGLKLEWTETNEYGYEVLHQHDMSVTVEHWKCAAGHEAEFTRYGECWCGWRAEPAEPAKYLGEGSS